ncbi:DNA polymerase alpha subunit B, partial [Tolypocladium paradoxum]
MADAELQSRFSPNKPLEADVLAELQSTMRLHDLSAEDLFFKWESYCIELDLDAQEVSLRAVRNLKAGIQDALEKSSHRAATQHQAKGERRINATPRAAGADVFGMLDGLVPSTPAGGRLGSKGGASARRRMETPRGAVGGSPAGGMRDQLSAMNGVPANAFSERANPGEVVEVLNAALAPAPRPLAPFPEPRIRLTAASDQKKLAYRPLAMKLSEASEILDDRIDDFAAL